MYDATDELDDFDDLELPTRSSPLTKTVAVLGVGCTLALAYFAYSIRLDNQATYAELSRYKKEHEELAKAAAANEIAQKKVSELSTQLSASTQELDGLRVKVGNYAAENEAIEKQLEVYRDLSEKLTAMTSDGKISINYRRGRMILEMPSAILFPSGVAELSSEGSSTVRELARVLRRIRTQRFIVSGHTDNVPIHNRNYSSNWALSSARAVAVTEALIHGGVPASRLGAAGFAHTDPVARNRSRKGRQLNRRIEIMIEPNMRPFAALEQKLRSMNLQNGEDAEAQAQAESEAEGTPDTENEDNAPAEIAQAPG